MQGVRRLATVAHVDTSSSTMTVRALTGTPVKSSSGHGIVPPHSDVGFGSVQTWTNVLVTSKLPDPPPAPSL
jgi:hypothetical protein